MLRSMMRAKIHGATVTEVNLRYMGSVTLDEVLMEKLDILPNETVQVLNLNNGSRLTTYVLPGKRGSGAVAINGAAARLAQPGDKVLLVLYALMTEEEARAHRPIVAFVDGQNRIVEVRQETEATVPGKR
ncbi:MAG: aspartate 1-decarboxylase [Acidobacteria bacterium]|nr:aspartate 1-decarboxylase [Acidobacteriota bacterium]